jgi:hypothetical protein
MRATARAAVETEEPPIKESPLLWSTVAMCGVSMLAFFWRDFATIIAWFVG